MRFLLLLALEFAMIASARNQPERKMQPPPPTAPRPYEFPKAASKTLANGLRVFVIEDHRLPLVSASLQILAGNAYAPPEKAGLASMTAGLLREGTTTRSAQDLARAVDNAGGNLSASAGDDTVNVSMSFMKSFAALGFELMADITRNPSFAQEEVDRQMRQAQSNLAVRYADAEYIAPLAAARAIFATHPYAYPGDGTPESLRRIRRADIVAFYKLNYAPARAWLAIAGDLSPEEGFAFAEKHFGPWQAHARPDEKLPPGPEPRPQVLVIDMPNTNQTQIAVGHLGVPRNHPDYIALQLGNQIFGGSFNSRLNMKLRASEGLTYGASSYFEPNRFAGLFQATTFTRTEKTAEAIRMLVDLLKEFKENPATRQEFEEARAYLLGSFAIATETAGSVASRVLTAEINGLGSDYWTTYRRRLQELTREQTAAAIRRFLQPAKLSIVAAGNAAEFAKALEAFGPVRVLKSDEVDFTAPDLLKPRPKASASPESAARAQALIAKALDAMGGREKLAAIRGHISSGKLKLTLQEAAFDGESTETVLYPDRFKQVLHLPVGVLTQVFDAGRAWMAQGGQVQELPPTLAPGLGQAVAASSGGIGFLLAAAAGAATVQAIDSSSLLWKNGGAEATLTFDAASGHLARVHYRSIGLQGPAEIETAFSAFQTVGGVTLPFEESTSQNGQPVAFRSVTERKLNPDLTAADFAKPGQ